MLEPALGVVILIVGDFTLRGDKVEATSVDWAREICERYYACLVLFGNFLKCINGVSATWTTVRVS
eukprot:6204267-Heterocapsa_arctica.AAC.1